VAGGYCAFNERAARWKQAFVVTVAESFANVAGLGRIYRAGRPGAVPRSVGTGLSSDLPCWMPRRAAGAPLVRLPHQNCLGSLAIAVYEGGMRGDASPCEDLAEKLVPARPGTASPRPDRPASHRSRLTRRQDRRLSPDQHRREPTVFSKRPVPVLRV
jgi:hypothetical protein